MFLFVCLFLFVVRGVVFVCLLFVLWEESKYLDVFRPVNQCVYIRATWRERGVAARFVTTARFVTKVTKRAVMPARFVTNEVVTKRAWHCTFSSLGY